jgi:hypothetical protein
MLSPLRNRFGIPGVISVIALVFAMFGGAYAATNNGGGKATASAKAKPGPRGPRGKTGPAGPVGPAGPQGLAGTKGDTGAKGDKGDKGDTGNAGAAGSPGASGKSAEAASFVGSKGSCAEGGVEVKTASPTALVCNGAKGANGQTGFTETLPSGKTETGTWGIFTAGAGIVPTPISFNIPLAGALSASAIHLNPPGFEGEPGEDCPGKVANPTAEAGNLCVYAGINTFTYLEAIGYPERSVAGVVMGLSGEGSARGSWAVTAP